MFISTLERIREIEDFADDNSIILSLPASQIIELEDAGYVVDLATGEITGTNEDWFSLTPAAELLMWQHLPEVPNNG